MPFYIFRFQMRLNYIRLCHHDREIRCLMTKYIRRKLWRLFRLTLSSMPIREFGNLFSASQKATFPFGLIEKAKFQDIMLFYLF